MRSDIVRNLALAVSVPVLLGALTSCSVVPGSSGTLTVSGSAGPAGVTTPTGSPAPSGTSAPTGGSASSPASTGSGCKPGGIAVPAGARSAGTVDLDGDGRADTLWLAASKDARVLGVRTASGAGFSTSFPNYATGVARAYGGRVEGGAIILLEVGFATQALYAVTGCTIKRTLNLDRTPWAFLFDPEGDRVRSGAGCITIGSRQRLVGYHVEGAPDGDRFAVTRSTIRLSDGGRLAVAGRSETLGRALPEVSTIVQTGLSVSCGSDRGVELPA